MLLARLEVKADWVAQDVKLLRDEQLRQGRVLTKQEVTLAWHHGDLNNVLVRLARIEVRSFPDNCRWGGGGGPASADARLGLAPPEPCFPAFHSCMHTGVDGGVDAPSPSKRAAAAACFQAPAAPVAPHPVSASFPVAAL